MLDKLYLQILDTALDPDDPEPDLFQNRLRLLHTFLCTVERTSPSVATQLLHGCSEDNGGSDPPRCIEVQPTR
jgi:hypothetical protein